MITGRQIGVVAAAFAVAFVTLAAISAAIGTVSAQPASPAASPATDEVIQLLGMVETPGAFTIADLQELPSQTVEVDFQSGSGDQHHSYTGVLLWDVLEQAGLKLDPDRKNDQPRKYVVLTAKDGYE